MTAREAAKHSLPGPCATRVMIVDDSAVARAVLARMISAHLDFQVVALAGSSDEALDALKSVTVDAIVLDVNMPGTSGLEALPGILEQAKAAKVLIVSSMCEEGAEASVRALALGAADTLAKPGTGAFGGRFSEVLIERLRRISPPPEQPRQPPVQAFENVRFTVRAMPDCRLACLALGASTGGIHALGEFLRRLPSTIGAPILVTQHLPPLFMPYFARELETASGRTARVAEDGMALEAETIFIAPGEAHLGVRRSGSKVEACLSHAPASSGCLPSVDIMFSSVAEIYGKSALGVIFSGMGRDGLVGSGRVVERGGAVLVQNAETSAVWGMPRAVAEAGLASAILSPSELARRVAAACGSVRCT